MNFKFYSEIELEEYWDEDKFSMTLRKIKIDDRDDHECLMKCSSSDTFDKLLAPQLTQLELDTKHNSILY